MQPATQTPAPPPPPPPPAPPASPVPGTAEGASQVVIEGGAPVVATDAASLRQRRSELSRQLISADNRRKELVAQLEKAPPGSQAGLMDRIRVLDDRIVQIEKDIAQNGDRLASLPATTSTTSEDAMPPGSLSNGQITGISIVFIIFVLMPLAVSFGRAIWKRGSLPRPQALPAGTEQRLERMEQGLDAIAIEIERVSESQRFVTRLLAERQELPALEGAPAAAPARLQPDRG